jgi:hypothetical protein
MLTNLDRGSPRGILGCLRAPGSGHGGHSEVRHNREVTDRVPHPIADVAIANRQAEIMMRIASEFGFTPASCSRISTPQQPELGLFDFMDRSRSDNHQTRALASASPLGHRATDGGLGNAEALKTRFRIPTVLKRGEPVRPRRQRQLTS